MRSPFVSIAIIPLIFLQSAGAVVYYVDATGGSDSNTGLSPSSAWKTISKVNSMTFSLGDSILFKRGEVWRGQLIPCSGNESGHITYGAYGTGSKPLLLGSVELSNLSDWKSSQSSIWESANPLEAAETEGSELLSNPSFDGNPSGWYFYREGGANATGAYDPLDYDTAPGSYSIESTASGTRQSEIQFYTTNLNITSGYYYKLAFRAKSTINFTFASIELMKSDSPWSIYYSAKFRSDTAAADEWRTYEIIYKSNTDASDGRITFYLGGILPAGATLNIDTLSFRRCKEPENLDKMLWADVGNIIFNNEQSTGIKVWNEEDLDQQGEFWYDENKRIVKVYSETNPASYYSDAELALRRNIIEINSKNYFILENLDLRYGGAHGIGGSNTHHVIARDLDISYIGGGDQYGGDRTVRFGNGIEFWNSAHDNIVERCRLWEIYDAALTNQGNGQNSQHSISYRNNIVWNSEYCFEYWNRPENSTTRHIYFENNICFRSGYGWGHGQRSDPSGKHLSFFSNLANTSDFYIRNNIFYESRYAGLDLSPNWNGSENLVLDYNCWHQLSGTLIRWKGTLYSAGNFSKYQNDTNKDANSLVAEPLFINSSGNDFHPARDSPVIDKGMDNGVASDFDGSVRPLGAGPDIGAFEYATYHRADKNEDGCVEMEELSAFLDLWNLNSQDVTIRELMEAIGLWKQGC